MFFATQHKSMEIQQIWHTARFFIFITVYCFYRMNITQFGLTDYYCRISGLFLDYFCYKYSCYEHLNKGFCVIMSLHFSEINVQGCPCQVRCLIWYETDRLFKNGCKILHSHWYCDSILQTQCTIQWFLVYLQNCANISRHGMFSLAQKMLAISYQLSLPIPSFPIS